MPENRADSSNVVETETGFSHVPRMVSPKVHSMYSSFKGIVEKPSCPATSFSREGDRMPRFSTLLQETEISDSVEQSSIRTNGYDMTCCVTEIIVFLF